MTRFDRLSERVRFREEFLREFGRLPSAYEESLRLSTIERRESESRPDEQRKPNAADGRKQFDISSWRLTPKAEELLIRSGAIKVEDPPTREKIAVRNEAKYDASPTYADRMSSGLDLTRGRNYDAIESLAGTNGDCHSRETTYRRYKFGKGTLSHKGWLRSGFQENGEHR